MSGGVLPTAPFASMPILIGGEGRSGTTLLSLVLNAHPEIACGPELHFRGPVDLGGYVLDLLDRRRGLDADGWEALRRDPDSYPGFHFVNRCHRCGIDPETLRELVVSARRTTGGDLVGFGDRACLIDAIGEHMRRSEAASRWGIKVMTDLRIIDRYVECWPEAVVVHLVRDGRDVAASQLRDHQGWGYADVRTAAERWSRMLGIVDRLAEDHSIVELRYEDLVRDPEVALRPLFSRLGIEWHENCARHEAGDHALYRHPYRHPSIDSVRRPREETAIGRWRAEFDSEQADEWMQIAGAALHSRGYDP